MKECGIIIGGMTCSACSARIEKTLNSSNGVIEASVNLASSMSKVKYDETKITSSQIKSIIDKLGYTAEFPGKEKNKSVIDLQKKEIRKLFFLTAASSALAFPLLLSMIIMHITEGFSFIHNPYLHLALSAPVQFIIGFRFYKKSFITLKTFSPGMDFLVALGTTAAYFFSLYNLFFLENHTHLYFESSAVLITLILLGKYLEAKAKVKTSSAIQKLMNLSPANARILREGKEIEIPAADLIPGDAIVIRPGETIPADGIVISGFSAVDESMITGESIPSDKSEGSRITAGTLNTSGSLIMRAEKTGEDTIISRIIHIVENAALSKAPVQKLTDKISGIFAWSVLSIAAITFISWLIYSGNVSEALANSVSVLVIACPCALGLATPTALIAGIGIGASNNILIKDAESLEMLNKISILMIDKTGTLTDGKLSVNEIIADEDQQDNVLRLSSIAEKFSEHPLAKAVRDKCSNNENPSSFMSFAGKGVSCIYDNKSLLCGNAKFMRENGIPENEIDAITLKASKSGKTFLLTAFDNKLIGAVTFDDKLKDSAKKTIESLSKMGIKTIMLTGDNYNSAEKTAKECNIETFYHSLLPEEKAQLINKYESDNHRVLFAGDGINDAPALASASTGIAVAGGSDIAMDSCGIALLKNDLKGIENAIRLSSAVMRKIKQNLFWAFFYNCLGIPLAALGFLSPLIAGSAMAFSSVSVVTNSLLLKKMKIFSQKPLKEY